MDVNICAMFWHYVSSMFLAIQSLHTKILEGGATHHNNDNQNQDAHKLEWQCKQEHKKTTKVTRWTWAPKKKTMMTTLIAKTLSSLLFFLTNQKTHERRQDPTMMTLRPRCTQTINNNAHTKKRRQQRSQGEHVHLKKTPLWWQPLEL